MTSIRIANKLGFTFSLGPLLLFCVKAAINDLDAAIIILAVRRSDAT